jgi:hypothetical protein
MFLKVGLELHSFASFGLCGGLCGLQKCAMRVGNGLSYFALNLRNACSINHRQANGPELSCGGEAPQQRNPVRAWYVLSDCNSYFRACKIVDGYFRQLERLVRRQRMFRCHLALLIISMKLTAEKEVDSPLIPQIAG